MNKPRLDLRYKKDVDLQSFAQKIIRAMRDGGQFSGHFADQQEQVEAAAVVVEDFVGALTQQRLAENALRAATKQKQQARKALERALTSLAATVAVVAGDRKDVIAASGMELRKERSRVGRLDQPQDLRADASPNEGEVLLDWNPVRGSSIYEVEFRLQSQDDSHWQRHTFCTASKCTVPDLTPGVAYYFRVRAIGTAGPSPWSDLALRRAP